MAKLRLQIERRNHNIEIIMKNIISIIIDDIYYQKSDYCKINSRVTQEFYNFIKRNKNLISYISYTESDNVIYLYLKNGKIHREDGTAFLNYYYLNGNQLSYEEWKQKIRKIKLEKLKN